MKEEIRYQRNFEGKNGFPDPVRAKCFKCEKYGSYYCDNYRIYILCYDC